MNIILGLVFIIPIYIIGLLKNLYSNTDAKNLILFAEKYLSDFESYIDNPDENIDTFRYLTENSAKMQNQLEDDGEMQFILPFGKGVMPHFRILIDGLPMIQNFFITGRGYLDDQAYQLARYVSTSLLRTIGEKKEILLLIKKSIRNPILSLKDGYSTILSVPFYLLSFMGLLGKRKPANVFFNPIFKTLSGCVTLIGLYGSLITIFGKNLFPNIWNWIISLF